jgi:hypothetical protein
MLGVVFEFRSANIGKDIGNIISIGPQGPDMLRPFAVLHPAAALATGIFFRWLNGAVIAKPAEMLKGSSWRPLHRLYPAAQDLGIGQGVFGGGNCR